MMPAAALRPPPVSNCLQSSSAPVLFFKGARTLTGNYQLLQLAPWLLTSENPVRFEFISHKLLRLCVPFALAGALGSSLWMAEAFYRALAVAQLALYSLALLALVRPTPRVVGRR